MVKTKLNKTIYQVNHCLTIAVNEVPNLHESRTEFSFNNLVLITGSIFTNWNILSFAAFSNHNLNFQRRTQRKNYSEVKLEITSNSKMSAFSIIYSFPN